MKKYYKVASIALVGVLVAQIIPTSVFAEGENNLNTNADDVAVVTESLVNTTVAPVAAANQEFKTVNIDVPTPSTDENEAEKEDVLTSEENKDADTETEAEEVKPEANIVVTPASTTEETSEDASEETETEPANQSESTVVVLEEQPAAAENTEVTTEEPVAAEEAEDEKLLEELENNEELELVDAKEDEDFNSDGISDLYTKMLCDGEILTESGSKVFGDYSYARLQQTNDLDADGLTNGEEVKVETKEDGTLYAVLVSDPCKADTDNDGINDYDDTDKWSRGLAGGVLGNVRLVARHDETKGPTHGHVYIVYTSYVNNLEISIDNLYDYYVTNDEYKAKLREACDSEDASVVSWRSTVSELNDANESDRKAAADDLYVQQNISQGSKGTVVLNRGDYISIGNYGMSDQKTTITQDYIPYLLSLVEKDENAAQEIAELTAFYNAVTGEKVDHEYVATHIGPVVEILATHNTAFADHVLNGTTPGGVWINRELYNQKYAYDQGPNEVIEQDATGDQLNVMLDYFAENSYFNTFSHNCTTAATGAWNAAFGTKTDENGNAEKTDYNVTSGVKIDKEYYNGYSEKNEEFHSKLDFPVFVKYSIKSMKNLPGYVGSMTYVTGKRVVDTVVSAVKKFDITKLFTKKAATDNGSKENPADSGKGGSNNSGSRSNGGSNSSSNSGSANAYKAGDVDTFSSISENDSELRETVIAAASNLNTKHKSSGKKAVVKTASADGDEEASEGDVEDEVEININKKSDVAEKQIADEEVPLAKVEKAFNWLWLILILIAIAVAGTITAFEINKKKNR